MVALALGRRAISSTLRTGRQYGPVGAATTHLRYGDAPARWLEVLVNGDNHEATETPALRNCHHCRIVAAIAALATAPGYVAMMRSTTSPATLTMRLPPPTASKNWKAGSRNWRAAGTCSGLANRPNRRYAGAIPNQCLRLVESWKDTAAAAFAFQHSPPLSSYRRPSPSSTAIFTHQRGPVDMRIVVSTCRRPASSWALPRRWLVDCPVNVIS